MHIVIEPVNINEVKLLADLSRTTFYDTFYKQNTEEDIRLFLAQSFDESTLKKELSDPGNYFFFAKADNAIAGYLKLSTRETPDYLKGMEALEIVRIYTVKERLGSGVGKSLMEFSISFGKQLKKDVIWLGVWEHNIRAINFYQRFGFEKFGEHLFILGNDPQNDWLMKKELIV